ncbi:putative ubiquitin ligase subunit protein [Alternaria alternata]|nr:putative ubiquitin ligase subunit protein [Alternaria alternata]
MTARLPLPLHFTMAQDTPSVPARQPRLGVPEVWSINAGESRGEMGFNRNKHGSWFHSVVRR